MLYGRNTFLAGGRFTGRVASLSTGGGTTATVAVTIMLVVIDRGRRRGFVRFALVAVLVAILLLATMTVMSTVSLSGTIIETTVASCADVVVFDLILGDFKFERIRRLCCWLV